jgi:hypothetical protein
LNASTSVPTSSSLDRLTRSEKSRFSMTRSATSVTSRIGAVTGRLHERGHDERHAEAHHEHRAEDHEVVAEPARQLVLRDEVDGADALAALDDRLLHADAVAGDAHAVRDRPLGHLGDDVGLAVDREQLAAAPVHGRREDAGPHAHHRQVLARRPGIVERERRRAREREQVGLRGEVGDRGVAVGDRLVDDERDGRHDQRDERRREHDVHDLVADRAHRAQHHGPPVRTVCASASMRELSLRPLRSAASCETFEANAAVARDDEVDHRAAAERAGRLGDDQRRMALQRLRERRQPRRLAAPDDEHVHVRRGVALAQAPDLHRPIAHRAARHDAAQLLCDRVGAEHPDDERRVGRIERRGRPVDVGEELVDVRGLDRALERRRRRRLGGRQRARDERDDREDGADYSDHRRLTNTLRGISPRLLHSTCRGSARFWPTTDTSSPAPRPPRPARVERRVARHPRIGERADVADRDVEFLVRARGRASSGPATARRDRCRAG